ncbi:MAG TPA: hypothetical protein VI815_01010 [Candidatus Nanoarchaeia archaeon]|nr:hypothetical protein [Candidatus Nanoarchaeia archaeon]
MSIDILFCGLIRTVDLFKKSLQDLSELKKQGLVNNIYFSTWKGEPQKNPEIHQLMKDMNVIIMESEEPAVGGEGNIWKQMKALDVGLGNIKGNNFILKTRSDVYIHPDFLKKIITSKDLFEITEDLPNGNIFKAKVWVPWFEITRPFYMADECFYGLKNDLKLLVNYEKKYFEEYTLGPGGPHIMRFINPFLEKYPILYNSLEKYSDETSIKKGLRKFSRKIFSLDRFKFLRKLNDRNRFHKLRFRLNEKDYLNYLAASYFIVNSHFYVNSDELLEQVIFREHSKPKVKLNPTNLESNFSHKMARFEYGGQIYSYNQELVKNICNGNIEKTEVAIKLLDSLQDFKSNNLR